MEVYKKKYTSHKALLKRNRIVSEMALIRSFCNDGAVPLKMVSVLRCSSRSGSHKRIKSRHSRKFPSFQELSDSCAWKDNPCFPMQSIKCFMISIFFFTNSLWASTVNGSFESVFSSCSVRLPNIFNAKWFCKWATVCSWRFTALLRHLKTSNPVVDQTPLSVAKRRQGQQNNLLRFSHPVSHSGESYCSIWKCRVYSRMRSLWMKLRFVSSGLGLPDFTISCFSEILRRWNRFSNSSLTEIIWNEYNTVDKVKVNPSKFDARRLW